MVAVVVVEGDWTIVGFRSCEQRESKILGREMNREFQKKYIWTCRSIDKK